MLTFEIPGTMLNVCLLVLATVLNARAGNTTADELEQIKSLNETENLQIFGDSITIVLKNVTKSGTEDCDAFEQYLHTHFIRIKSPLKEGDHLDFKLNDLIPNDEIEGREKKRKGPIRDILIPLLLALKYKTSVLLVFMILVTFIAFKGFWAGMSGLVISKVVGLKVLLQSLSKPEEDRDEHEEQNDDHDHSPDDEEESEDNAKPIVVFLRPHSHRRKFSQRPERPSMIRNYYNPKGWDPWGRLRLYEKNGLGQ